MWSLNWIVQQRIRHKDNRIQERRQDRIRLKEGGYGDPGDLNDCQSSSLELFWGCSKESPLSPPRRRRIVRALPFQPSRLVTTVPKPSSSSGPSGSGPSSRQGALSKGAVAVMGRGENLSNVELNRTRTPWTDVVTVVTIFLSVRPRRASSGDPRPSS